MYRNLDSEKIVDTIETLCKRIDERFPNAGLAQVCRELLVIAKESQIRSAWIAKPRRLLRFIIGLLVLGILAVMVLVLANTTWPATGFDIVVLVQVSEAGINVCLLLGAAILFLATTEARVKRGRALKQIHEMRALAHVVDMHQLTKDPERLVAPAPDTPSSPTRNLNAAELTSITAVKCFL